MEIAPFKLERFFAKHEFSAPYLLCSSDCETLTTKEVLEFEPGALDQYLNLKLGYTESLGHTELRVAISNLYQGISPDQVLVHAGAEEAIFNFMNSFLRKGDHVIVHAPFYQSLGEVATSIGADADHWIGDPDNGYTLDLNDLKELLNPNTKLVVVNFPHNPTGFLPSLVFQQSLSALSDKHGFRVFSDEVYRGLELDQNDRLPAFATLNTRAVSLGVMSKTYGLPGLRIGWILTQDQEIFQKMASFKDYTTICNSAPSEFLATIALKHANRIEDRNKAIIHKNLDLIDGVFKEFEEIIDWHRPKGGSIAFPNLKQGDVTVFCAELLKQKGVLLVPGSLYGPAYNGFRIGFGRKNCPEALEHLHQFLQGN